MSEPWGTSSRRWIFIAGDGRSGSTLLASLLSDGLGAFDCGELHLLWESLVDGRRCACRTELRECPVWSEVAARVREELGFESNEEGAAVMRRRLRQRELLQPRIPAPHEEERRLRVATERAVEAVTGAELFVDSSKLASVLWTASKLDRPLTVAHLVRDPRAVAYSWRRPTPDPTRDDELLPSKSLLRSSMDWVRGNTSALRVTKRSPSLTTVAVRYEDLTASPREVLGGLLERELSEDPVGFSGEGLAESHAVAGNPRRFVSDQEIRPDVRWRQDMARRDRVVVTALTAPLLPRFGYAINPS